MNSSENCKKCQFVLDIAAGLRYNDACTECAPLAQLVEHLTLNQGVPGSSP